MQGEPTEVKYSIQGMDCADCALSLERSLAQIQGIEQVSVNFTTGLVEAHGNFDPQKLVQRVEALGYKARTEGTPEEKSQVAAGTTGKVPKLPGFLGYLYASLPTRLALLGAILLAVSALLSFLPVTTEIHWARLALQLIAAGLAGYPIANRGVRAAIISKQVTTF